MWSKPGDHINLILGLVACAIWIFAVLWYFYSSGIYHTWIYRWRHRKEGPSEPNF